MGPRRLLSAELAVDSPVESVDSFSQGQTYFQLIRTVTAGLRGRRKVQYTARVSAHADLNLNGSYLVQLELDRDEIAKLFYLTNGDRGLPGILEAFSTFKHQERWGLPKPQVEKPTGSSTGSVQVETPAAKLTIEYNKALLKKLDILELSLSSSMSLEKANMVYVGDLVQQTEAALLRTPNFGRRSVNEIKEKLSQMGLHLGMEVPNWPPENVEQLSKSLEDA